MSYNIIPTEEAKAWSKEIINQAFSAAERSGSPTSMKLDGIGAVATYDGGTKISVSFVFTCNSNLIAEAING